MPVTCQITDRNIIAAITGELDHHGAKAVMEELDRQIDLTLPQTLTINLEGMTFTDSSGIAVLLRAYRRMGQLNGAMTVTNSPVQAKRVFSAAGLDKLISFV